jgi:excisionase family DNA binding protein
MAQDQNHRSPIPSGRPRPHRVGEDFISQCGLARRFGVNRSTIRRWVDKDLLPRPLRLGGKVLFQRTEVEAVIRARIQARSNALR